MSKMSALKSAVAVGIMFIALPQLCYGQPVGIDWINDIGMGAGGSLESAGTFTTNYVGTDAVTLTLQSGSTSVVSSPYQVDYSNSLNPPYLSQFTGSVINGTGDGVAGHMGMLEISRFPGTSVTFDFDFNVGPNNRLIFSDIDFNESVKVEAFLWNGLSFQSVSTSAWIHTPYSGQTGIVPDSTWASWDGGSGQFLAGTGANINEPANTLTPSNDFDRLVITSLGGNPAGTWEFQMISVPEPSSIFLTFSIGLLAMFRRGR